MNMQADLVIIGGGLNGPALALAAAGAGMTSVVVDPLAAETRAAPGFDGRAYALALASRRMLGVLGLWEGLAPHAQPILEIKASDGRPGEGAAPFFLHFHHGELEEGAMGHMLEDRILRPALLQAMAEAPRITHLPGRAAVDHGAGPAGITGTLDEATRIAGARAGGCDGRDSPAARREGIARIGWGYAQTALVCAVGHERPHGGVAHQFFMPGGPLAILPLPGNRSSIVWTEAEDRAAGIAALDDAGVVEVLRPRFGDFLGEIRLEGARFSYPLRLSLAERFVGARLALAGDAAHGIHPIAGQGLNLGLRDVAALAEVLAEAQRRGEDIGASDVLARYQRWRRFDTAALALATDGVNRLFSNDNAALRLARDLGMGMVSALPALRRGFMRQAAGLNGDLPRLLQGQPL
ncbi:MAG: FAD-dependent monooxygenase [Rhodobacteraceae bacterium]|nr:FAD-dependent monooxygenase [Paracoccaceae bacterium]